MRVRFVVCLIFFVSLSVVSATAQQRYLTLKPKKSIVCYASPADQPTVVEPPETYQRWKRAGGSARAKTSNIEVTYIGFSEQAKTAFQQAVDIWETIVTSDVPIRVNATWEPLGSGVLGSAIWGTVHANFDGAQRMQTWYPAALAEKMAKKDLNGPEEYEVYASFSSTFNWFYGTGTIASGQYDLTTVVLHEIGHGLGFVDGFDYSNGVGYSGVLSTGLPIIYDHYLENFARQGLYHDFTSGTTAMGTALASDNIYFNSPLVLAQNANAAAKIYSPFTYSGGSSISHLDESTFNGTTNALMTPQIGSREINHDPGPLVKSIFSEMGWVFTYINHTDLKNTENKNGPFVVKAVITSDAGPVTQPKLHYIADADEVTVDMTPTSNPDEYQATIPSTGNTTQYAYYISVSDNLNREYTRPGKLIRRGLTPQQFYTTFTAGPDTQAPKISHTPKTFILNTTTSLPVEAYISDNLGIASAKLEYKINGVSQTTLTMNPGTPDSLYTAVIDLGTGLAIGDKIEYRLIAKDIAAIQQTTTRPASGYFEVNVTGLAATQDTYQNNFNTASGDFFGDGFSIATPTGFSNGAIHSTHPYPEGDASPGDEINLTYQLRIPIRVKSEDATVSFNEVVLVEPGETGSVFGSASFFDYVVVEGSADGGSTWKAVANGYDSRDYSPWLERYNSASSGNNSTAVGDAQLFRARRLNLLDEFSAGDEVVIRFRLFSDQLAAGWGWAIDDLKIQIDETGPDLRHDHFDYVLAGTEKIFLNSVVTDPSGINDLSIEFQVNGANEQAFEFPVEDGVEQYGLDYDISSLNAGDILSYRVITHDKVGNARTLPSTGMFNVVVFEPKPTVDAYDNDFEGTDSDFIGNFFTINKPTSFAGKAIHSMHKYLDGFGTSGSSSYSYMLTKPVKLRASNGLMVFDEIAVVEGHANGVSFGTEAFNDYVIVEGSSDGGVTWKSFIDGYDAVGQSSWVSLFSNGTNASQTHYRKRTIDLFANGNFKADDVVLVRFRLFADQVNNGWGWSIDNLSIQGAITDVTESLSDADVVLYPNPVTHTVTVDMKAYATMDLSVIDMKGQEVSALHQSASGPAHLDMSQLPEGIYVIRIQSGTRVVMKKVFKAHP